MLLTNQIVHILVRLSTLAQQHSEWYINEKFSNELILQNSIIMSNGDEFSLLTYFLGSNSSKRAKWPLT